LGEVGVEKLEYVGIYRNRAASDDPTIIKTVEIRLYRGELVGEPVASSEIIELVWFGAAGDRGELLPSLADDRVAALKPTCSQRRSTSSDARRPCL
jgi:hypothetical protein